MHLVLNVRSKTVTAHVKFQSLKIKKLKTRGDSSFKKRLRFHESSFIIFLEKKIHSFFSKQFVFFKTWIAVVRWKNERSFYYGDYSDAYVTKKSIKNSLNKKYLHWKKGFSSFGDQKSSEKLKVRKSETAILLLKIWNNYVQKNKCNRTIFSWWMFCLKK